MIAMIRKMKKIIIQKKINSILYQMRKKMLRERNWIKSMEKKRIIMKKKMESTKKIKLNKK